MKPNELMIGDWLKYKGQCNAFEFRVEQIKKRKVGYHAEPCESRMYYLPLNEVHPIAITKEILERNGFERWVEYEKYEWCEGNVKLWVILDASVVGEEKNHLIHIDAMRSAAIPVTYHDTIKYVHELQHVLRLCKIEREIVIY